MARTLGNRIADVLDHYTGEQVVFERVTVGYDGTTITVDNEDTYIDGVIYKKTSRGWYVKRVLPNGAVNPAWFGITNDGTLTPKDNWDSYFTYIKKTGAVIQFGEGTYVLPYDYTFDFGSASIQIQGVHGKTIITAGTGINSVLTPQRIDITQPKPATDGVYQVWITGPTIHTDYSALTLSLDDYIQVSGGAVSKLTLSQVKALNYVTELDLTDDEPQVDGLYVAAVAEWVSGGGFTNNALPWATNVYVTMGAIVQRSGGVWSRYWPGSSTGFNFSGDFRCSGVTFYNIPFFLFTPTGKGQNKTFIVEECGFDHVRRVLAFDRIVNPNRWVDVTPHSVEDGAGFSFDLFAIRNCVFDNIHESVAWAIPTMKRIDASGNTFKNCHNISAGITYMPQDNVEFYQKAIKGNTFRNNEFVDCVSRTGENGTTIHRWFLRTLSNADISGNRFVNTNGTTIYMSGTNCMVHDNYFEPFMEDIGGNLENITIKVQPPDGVNMIYNNTQVGGIAPFCFQQSTSETILTNNSIELSDVNDWILSTTTSLNKKKFYIIQDLSQFRTLAGAGNYDESVTSGKVYYNPRTNIWEAVSETPTAPVVFNASVQSAIRHPIRIINNNKIVADRIFRTFATYSIDYLEITGNKDVVVNTLYAGAMDIRKVVMNNNVCYVRATPTLTTPIADDVDMADNSFHRSHAAKIIIRALNRVTFQHNDVLGDKTFVGMLSEFSLEAPVIQEAIEFQSDNNGVVTLDSNLLSAELTRDGCARVLGCGEIVMQRNTFDQFITETNRTTRNSLVIVGATGLSKIRALGNKHIIQDVEGDKIGYSLSIPGHTIDWVEVKDEVSGENGVVPTRLISGSDVTISLFDHQRVETRGATLFNGVVTSERSDVAAAQSDSTANDVAGLVSDFNSLLAKLRTAGLLKE